MAESILLRRASRRGTPARLPAQPAVDLYLSFLSLPTSELCARIEAELEANPVLVSHDAPTEGAEPAAPVAEEDLPVEEWMADLGRPSFRAPSHNAQETHEGFLRSLPERPEGLQERLHQQFLIVEEDPWRRWVGEQIIFNLDDRGFVRGRLSGLVDEMNRQIASRARVILARAAGKTARRTLAAEPPGREPDARIRWALLANTDVDGALRSPLVGVLDGIGVKPAEAEAVLRAVQGLDPTGVGARDLRECLLLQLAERGGSPLARRLVEKCLHEVEAGNLRPVARKLGVSLEKVRAAARVVLSLDHAPGLGLSSLAPEQAAPDAVVERRDGSWEVRLLAEGMPRLAIDRRYARRARLTADPDEREFLERHLASARATLWAIEERGRSLQRVCDAIVASQAAFLQQGASAMARIPLAIVARRAGLPEHAVTRAIQGKSLATPFGVHPLASFVARQTRTRRRGK